MVKQWLAHGGSCLTLVLDSDRYVDNGQVIGELMVLHST